MLLTGILFLLIGLLIILNQKYRIVKIQGGRTIEERERKEKDNLDKYKILLAIFSIILGVFCIINYIIY
ncbi:MAG: hypothetical protein GXY88_01285 [Tissierellia bacterium]|nr:hypothetical protein [Tissierellia bacterium]